MLRERRTAGAKNFPRERETRKAIISGGGKRKRERKDDGMYEMFFGIMQIKRVFLLIRNGLFFSRGC